MILSISPTGVAEITSVSHHTQLISLILKRVVEKLKNQIASLQLHGLGVH
jgi:hypothetical protein